jgi:hypothetical protein
MMMRVLEGKLALVARATRGAAAPLPLNWA